MKSSARRIFEIVLWSGVTNLMLLAAFLVGWNFYDIRSSLWQPLSWPARTQKAEPSWAVTAANILGAMTSGSLQSSSASQLPERGDLEASDADPQRLKRSLNQVAETSLEKNDDVPYLDEGVSEAGDAAPEVGDGEASFDVVGPEASQAQSLSPVLRMNRKSGKLEIGNFETVSLTGDASQCLEMGYTLLGDAGAAQTELKLLAQSRFITMARICASNGSVVITCRSDQVTISPRKMKPNESCTG
jgi:hypothetical protein